MAQREGSIYLSLFVASFILFATMVVVVFILQADLEERQGKVDTVQKALDAEEERSRNRFDEINELKTLIGGPNAADAWPDSSFYRDKLGTTAEKFNRVNKDFNAAVTDRTFTYLSEPYDEFASLLDALLRAKDKASTEAKTVRDQHEARLGEHKKTVESLEGTNQQQNTQIVDLQSEVEDNAQASRQQIADLSAQVEDLEDQITRMKIKQKQDLAFKENKIASLQIRLDRLNSEKVRNRNVEDIEPDGAIVKVEPRTKVAWIDRGQTHHLGPGTIFRVFQHVGGKKIWKGRVEVRRIMPDLSEVRILEETDPLNPISANDQITSLFYDPKATPVFVFAGDSKRLDMPYVKRKLATYGARVDQEVGVHTDFLVALENFRDTSEYRSAKELNVIIVRESDLVAYMQ